MVRISRQDSGKYTDQNDDDVGSRLERLYWELNIDLGNYKDVEDIKREDSGKYTDQDDDGSRLQRLYWELN